MAFKRRLKFDKRIRFKKQMNIIYILLFIVLASTGIVYAYIKSNLNINGTANVTAARWDVHFTNLNVTTGNYSGAIRQINGSNSWWRLRSARSADTDCFYNADTVGYCNHGIASSTGGVSPSFRIG